MDVLDRKIICILENNSRTPISHIAKQLRTNRNVISYRINNLIKNGVIKKYITSLNLGKLGYSSYKLYFKIKRLNKREDLINFFKNKKEIISLIQLEGEYNLSAVIVTKNIADLDLFITKIKTTFENLIKEIQVSIVVYSKIFKFEKLLLGKKNASLKIEKYSSHEKNIQLNDVDKKILKTISQDANLSYIEIMQKTKLSLDVIKYRMKKLKKNIISSFRLVFDSSKMGYFHYAILIKTENLNKSDEERLVAWSAMKQNVLYCTKRIGNYDFEMNVAITDINNLKDFINELQIEFSENIDTYMMVLVSNVLKLNYLPF